MNKYYVEKYQLVCVSNAWVLLLDICRRNLQWGVHDKVFIISAKSIRISKFT
jgi:hypothetical protein